MPRGSQRRILRSSQVLLVLNCSFCPVNTFSHQTERGSRLLSRQDAVCRSQGGTLASHLLHDPHPQADSSTRCPPNGTSLSDGWKATSQLMNCSNLVHFLPAVPPGGADFVDRGDLSAHQFCLLQPLVLHRPGNLGDAHPPLPLPAPPETLQGGSSGTCAELHGHAGHFANRCPSCLRCHWPSPSPSPSSASSSWFCLCTRTPGTQV